MKLSFIITVSLVFAVPFCVHAGVLEDDFTVDHDYLVSGTTNTIWDGVQYSSPAVVTTADANLTNAGALTVVSHDGYWGGSDASGFLVFMIVDGDFVADLEIRTSNGVYNHDMGIMARVPDLGDAGPGEDYVSTRYYNYWPGIGIISFRVVDDDSETNYDHGSLERFAQLERSGDTFYYRTKVSSGDSWTLHETIARPDMSGLPLQVGIWQATFTSSIGNAQFEHFRIEGPNINPPETPTPAIETPTPVIETPTPGVTTPSTGSVGIMLLLVCFTALVVFATGRR
jgi:hypothetical protein